jgi:hypothetical protein
MVYCCELTFGKQVSQWHLHNFDQSRATRQANSTKGTEVLESNAYPSTFQTNNANVQAEVSGSYAIFLLVGFYFCGDRRRLRC